MLKYDYTNLFYKNKNTTRLYKGEWCSALNELAKNNFAHFRCTRINLLVIDCFVAVVFNLCIHVVKEPEEGNVTPSLGEFKSF